jgi:hypothetical protein
MRRAALGRSEVFVYGELKCGSVIESGGVSMFIGKALPAT